MKISHYFQTSVELITLILLLNTLITVNSQDDQGSDLQLQPGFDNVNITQFLMNDRFLKLQLKCVLFNGPCDIAGKWIKPRVKAALMGECLKCTGPQTRYFQSLMTVLQTYFPDIYKAAVAKYGSVNGISAEDQKLIDSVNDKINSESGWKTYKLKLDQVIQDMKDGKIAGVPANNSDS